MTAQELMREIYGWAVEPVSAEDTVDVLKAGDPNATVRKVATCMMPTVDICKAVAAWGADLLIVHEPIFFSHREDQHLDDPMRQQKQALVQSLGLTVYRFHDYIHSCQPDIIVEGLLKRLGWACEYADWEQPVRLHTPMTATAMARDIEAKLGLRAVRVAGAADTPITTFYPMVGSPGENSEFWAISRPDVDAILVGETSEWHICEYARDATAMGTPKSVLALGHVGSERDGMALFADKLHAAHPELDVRYFETPEVYG